MRFKVFCTTLLLAFLASVAGEAARQVANDSVADWMHRMSEALVPAESARARARLEFHELGETGVSIDMEVSRRRQPSEKHTFIEVIEPEVARGTVYEVVARGDESLERWEYLPPVRRLRRTSGIPRTDHFMGTDFTYEDLDFADALERQQGRVERVLQDDGRELVQVSPSTMARERSARSRSSRRSRWCRDMPSPRSSSCGTSRPGPSARSRSGMSSSTWSSRTRSRRW
jgi:hypothetical protein